MGVDYDANFGLGFKVSVESQDSDFDPSEYLSERISSPYEYFTTGDYLCGSEFDYYVVFKDGMGDIDTLEQRKKELMDYLKSNSIEMEGEFGVVGGLRIW